MTTLVLENVELKRRAHLHFNNNHTNRKKDPAQYNLYGIPLDQPIGTMALWYRKNSPSGYLRPAQKKYWNKTIRTTKINPQDDLYCVMENGEHPTYLIEVIELKG